MNDRLYVVVPCFNEMEVLGETAARLKAKMTQLISEGKIAEDSRVLLVDDGSSDNTWGLIQAFSAENDLFAGISLSRNRGHQNALLAGLMTVREKADMVISMDADLQDDVGAVDKMVDAYLDGADVVYGVRSSRNTDTIFKKLSAESYYKLLDAMGCRVVFNHADYRLLSARALEALSAYGEQDLFLRGIVPMLGYRTAEVPYDRGERFAGVSKYPLKKMLALAFSGILSLSLRPLRWIFVAGIVLLVLSAALLVYSVVQLFMGQTVLDWKLTTFSIWAIGGLLLTALGIVAEYIGRAYMEMKNRPRYHIGDTTGLD